MKKLAVIVKGEKAKAIRQWLLCLSIRFNAFHCQVKKTYTLLSQAQNIDLHLNCAFRVMLNVAYITYVYNGLVVIMICLNEIKKELFFYRIISPYYKQNEEM